MEKKNILIAGGSGFLGGALKSYFNGMGFQVHILTRNPKGKDEYYWDARHIGEWINEVEWADVLINLAGKSVDCRYTEKNKKEILDSRIESTALLAKVIQQVEHEPSLWLNASSSTIYIHSETQQMTEDEGVIGDDFSMNICKKWEEEFFKYDLEHTRRVALRTSIVFGKTGGAYPKIEKLTKLFMGGKQGSGNQFVSWIHILDFCRSIDFIIHHPEFVGSVNIVSPSPVKNDSLMKQFRKTLNKPFGFGQSKWLLELGAKIVGTETELLLKSRNVIPERLIENGFQFSFPDLDKALDNLHG